MMGKILHGFHEQIHGFPGNNTTRFESGTLIFSNIIRSRNMYCKEECGPFFMQLKGEREMEKNNHLQDPDFGRVLLHV